MTRLPELKEHLDEDAVPDAAEVAELEDFARSVPKLIGILPDVLRERSDPRHSVALAEMVAGLTACLDKLKPLALVRLFFSSWLPPSLTFIAACVSDSNGTSKRNDQTEPHTSDS
jgi:hypothetical protein